jgi:predicted flap endonuclease-1-like 5' DNA nuclease
MEAAAEVAAVAGEAGEMVAATPEAIVSPVSALETPESGPSESDIVDASDPEAMGKFSYDLEYIEGIGKAFGDKLKAIGIATPLDLLKRGATPKGRQEIAEQSGISGKLVLRWVNHVDLFRIKGVGSEYADLLEEAGVDTVMELSQRNAANLFQKLGQVNEQKNLVRKLPVASQVEEWVEQAKRLPRAIFY